MRRSRRPGTVSLNRALSKLGVSSRSEATALILEGRVRVGGRVVDDPATPVVPEQASIAIDGTIATRQRALTIALHKPRGVVTTRKDPEGRPTVYELVSDAGVRLVPIGRLDLATTGLLLMTTDTALAAWVTDPAHQVPRVYLVTVRGAVPDKACRRLESGLLDRGERLAARSVVVRKASRRETHLVATLVEGRHREIRRLFRALGHEVTRLKRVAVGGVELGTLPPGKWRVVPPEELSAAFPRARGGSTWASRRG